VGELSNSPWVILGGLALTGAAVAIPIAQMIQGRKRFRFAVVNLFDGTSGPRGPLVVILSGEVLNTGKAPLVPTTFDLEANIRGNIYQFDRILIPPDLQFGPGDFLQGPIAQDDLARYKGSFMEGQPVRGHLMFGSRELTIDQFRAARDNKTLRLTLSCTDAERVVRRADLDLPLKRLKEGEGVHFPKQDFNIRSKR
jgi:hypothetical protein